MYKNTIIKPFILFSFLFLTKNTVYSNNGEVFPNAIYSLKNIRQLLSCKGKVIKSMEIADAPYRIKKIVLDAGHGGKDGGCHGKDVNEKNITLKIAIKVGKLIKNAFPDVEVIYTRDKDVSVPLYKRADIANRNKVDLFISIHCNYVVGASHISGSETYVMGLHTAAHNLNVAKRENSSILYEDGYEKKYGGYNPKSPEGHIMMAAFQSAYMAQSSIFAQKVEKNLKKYAGRRSKGVKQAGFLVLKETTMPSVLIETGFLSNQSEEKFLNSNEGQSIMSESIFLAFKSYKNQLENNENNDDNEEAFASATSLKSDESNKNEVSNVVMEENTELTYSKEKTIEKEKEKSSALNKRKRFAPKFTVQLASSPIPLDTKNGKWKNVEYIVLRQEGSIYKYQSENFNVLEDAVDAQNRLRKLGFPDAFVVAYDENEKKISLKELLNNVKRN